MAALASAGLVLTYTAQSAITINIDGQVIHHRTWAGTVGNALDEAGVELDPEDVVAPALDTSVTDGLTITVRKAQAVALDADGTFQQIRTQAIHPLDVLQEQAITLQMYDVVQVNGRTYSLGALDDHPWEAAPTTIRVVRSVSLTIIDNGRAYEIHTTRPDVGGALDAAKAIARKICELSPMSIRASKQIATRGAELPLAQALVEQETWSAFKAMRDSADFIEGPKAFAEKRKPNWTGR